MALLDVKNLRMVFGGLVAVDDFELSIGENELVGLIGPNGAGKTTIFNMLTGVYVPTSGEILLDNVSMIMKSPSTIVSYGASRTFQNIRLFKELSVLDNIKIAYHNEMNYSIISSIFRTPKYWQEEKEAKKTCLELLKVFELDAFANTLAKNLPYGKQRKLEIARALATSPKILLLDEPAAGMNPQETEELMETINFIRNKFNITILLIEHDMKLVMGICERLVVIDYGRIIAKGTPEEIRVNKNVIKAYLGE
ncbi:ABC transporter ATP-binding protein [Mycoplasmatota bacterium zrk1]